MINIGSSFGDVNKKMFKMRTLLTGGKFKNNEPAYINDPESNNLITETDKIKEVTLEHCVKILQKYEIR